jgi:hypothetical protein
MDRNRFDAIICNLTDPPSRRDLLRALAGVLASLGGGSLAPHEIEAKKKRKKQRKRRRRNRASPSPVTTADAACHPTTRNSFTGFRRYAQSFVALRSGHLSSASFKLNFNHEGATFGLAIRAFDANGRPSTVLASTTIANVPATGDTDPPRTVTGVFAAPATVVAGQIYALAVTDLSSMSYSIQASPDDPCPDGIAFLDPEADGSFLPQPTYDLTFTTFVTA